MAKKFYITTSIAYTNAFPHIGFALELIQADATARYQRSLGKNVFFLTGTDEHGQKIVKAAQNAKKQPEEFTNEISSRFRTLKEVLNLSNDDFIRTTDEIRHWPVVQNVWLKLKENGDIYKKKYRGFYCVGCEAFITKKDLIDGKCKIHQKEPEVIEEENYFFRLSKYSKKIEKIIKNNEVKIIPQERKNEILSFIERGLEDVSFSRPRKDLKWGIPVPEDETQTIYVWADALINYISALGGIENNKFKKYWPPDIQFLGKDILRFHATIWLGMLLSLNLPLPKNIFVHGFITSNGQKMSKSLGNVIDPFELVKKYGSASSPQVGSARASTELSRMSSPQVGADAVRYFLLREIPPTEDGDFTYEKFEKRYNSDLAAGLGNLVARVVTLATKCKMKVQEASPLFTPHFTLRSSANEKSKNIIKNSKLEREIRETKKDWKQALEDFKFNEALIAIWNLISICDKYIEKEQPWSFDLAQDKEKSKKVISDLVFTISEIANLLQPFLPRTSEKIFKQIKTKKTEILFPKL